MLVLGCYFIGATRDWKDTISQGYSRRGWCSIFEHLWLRIFRTFCWYWTCQGKLLLLKYSRMHSCLPILKYTHPTLRHTQSHCIYHIHRLEICFLKLVIMLPVLYLLMRLMQLAGKEDHEILVVMMNVKIHSINYWLKWMVRNGHDLCVYACYSVSKDLILSQMWWLWLVPTGRMC